MESWTEIMTSQPLHENAFILRRPTVNNFANIIKISTIIKKTLKTQKRLKELEIMCSNAICISWYSKICWFLVKKYCKQNSSGVSRDLYIFWIFYGYCITVSSVIMGYVWHILGRGAFSIPPIREQPPPPSPPKKAHCQ